jgi:hypothetical protein
MKYAIISDDFSPRFENDKDFHILISDLSKEQVLGLIKAYEEYKEIYRLQNKHPMEIHVKVEGFEEPFNEFRGDELLNMNFGKIIPMWNFDSFKEENI